MNILVCIKPVPDPDRYGDLKIDPETKRLVREDIPTVINPCDKNALEAALQMRDRFGGLVCVLSMAPPFSRDKMLEALAMGADEAWLLSDRDFGGADTLATSFVLAEGARRIAREKGIEGFDLILAGHESADGATSHVPAQLAEWLGLPHVCNVKALEQAVDAGEGGCGPVLRAVRKAEAEDLVFECELPVVIAVSREVNKPRLVNAMGIIKARKKPLTVWTNEDLQLDPNAIGLTGSPTQPGQLFSPQMQRAAQPLGDDADAAAEKILTIAGFRQS